MKPDKDDRACSAGPQLVSVRFEFPHSTAIAVCIANSGAEWRSDALTPDYAPQAFRGRNAMLNVARAPKAVRHAAARNFNPENRKQIETAKL